MKIAIDPGHGMSNRQQNVYDPGATHIENGYRHEEATIALKYGLTLKDLFRAKGHEVFMTRDDPDDHAPERIERCRRRPRRRACRDGPAKRIPLFQFSLPCLSP